MERDMEMNNPESSSSPKPQIAIRRARVSQLLRQIAEFGAEGEFLQEKERLQRSVADLRAKIARDRSLRRRMGVLCRTEVHLLIALVVTFLILIFSILLVVYLLNLE